MIGKQDRWQEDLFVAGPLSSLIPEDHILKRVDAILDFSRHFAAKRLLGRHSDPGKEKIRKQRKFYGNRRHEK